MLIETLATLGTLGAGAAGLRYLWRLASAEDHRRAVALEAERVRLAAQVAAAQAAASAPPALPQHYAPHYTYTYHAGSQTYAPRISSAAQAAPHAALPAESVVRPSYVPAFGALLATGTISTGGKLVLGYAEGQPLYGSWLDLYSTAVAGKSGTGKSTSQRFFACQTALHGARFVVADPHFEAGADSLGASLAPLLRRRGLCEVAATEQAILEAVRLVQAIGAARLAGDADRTPVILWVDEATALLNRSEIGGKLGALLEAIAQEYRKVGVYASISGQIWHTDRMPSTLKHSLASVLAHRMHRDMARALVPSSVAKQVESLEAGQVLLYKTNGEQHLLTVPNTTAEDVQRVAALLTDGQPTMPRVAAREVAAEVVREVAAERTDQAAESQMPANVARVFAQIKQGGSLSAAIKEVYQCSGGRRYVQATEEVSGWLARVLP